MKEQKTAEQILHKHFIPIDPFDNLQILQAMQSYSDQQNAELMSEIERWKALSELGKKSIRELIKANEKLESVESENTGLLAWKESAMCELNALDLQALGAKLGIGLGQSVSENVHAKIDGLLERVKELESSVAYLTEIINGINGCNKLSIKWPEELENRVNKLWEEL